MQNITTLFFLQTQPAIFLVQHIKKRREIAVNPINASKAFNN
jgi:hypothetical protein